MAEQPADPSIDPNDERCDLETDWGYPPSLAKACIDQFSYMARIGEGVYVSFESAHPNSGEWVTLLGVHYVGPDVFKAYGGVDGETDLFPRGLDVRVSSIVWCADFYT